MSKIRFIITQESERLGRWLRLLGYDVCIFKKESLKQLYATAYSEDRAIVTKNLKIKKAPLIKVVHIKSSNITHQMREVIKRFRLKLRSADIFRRCSLCNRILKDIAKSKVKQKVPPFVYKYQRHFSYCPDCKRIYWQGTHLSKAKGFIASV